MHAAPPRPLGLAAPRRSLARLHKQSPEGARGIVGESLPSGHSPVHYYCHFKSRSPNAQCPMPNAQFL
ncbi:MAG: hypothetical protein F6J93_02030 [Oscillatoria sp. SIO1A7]|nr:hypothetical protein [Oscillatoria sp. SIO1A7]